MTRLAAGSTTFLLSISIALVGIACNGDKPNADIDKTDGKADAAKADEGADESAPADGADAAPSETSGAAAEGDGTGAGDTTAGETGEPAADGTAGETGEAAAEGAADSEDAATETGEDPSVELLETAKNLDNDDAAANKALADALAAGASKLDAAKAADARGEALMTKGESERAEKFFIWARDTHGKYADPVYNLAKLAAYAGDLDIAKEHLQELEKRGNKKLMKKVGVDPAFAPLHDDADVRKIYEVK